MANHLTMALIDTIRALHQRRWSQRRIARELGLDRATVARYLHDQAVTVTPPSASLTSAADHAEAKPAIAPLGTGPSASPAKPAIAPLGCEAVPADAAADRVVVPPPHGRGRLSDCEPWCEVILAKLALGLSAQRIYQDLSAEHDYAGSYYSVRRLVRRLEQRTPLPFRRMECGPGEEAQVDFGTGAPLLVDGHRRRPHVFRIVLSHSRKAYSEAVLRQTTEAFLSCIENAFWAFGGVPQRLVLDNLKAAVDKADWYDPDLHPKVRSFAAHYRIALLPTRPYTPRHKGKVERGVDYVQENALKGRTFASLDEENAFLREWEQTVADTRVHGTIRQQVGKLFLQVERPALQALPAEHFPFFQEAQRTVHRDGHVELERAFYSVPPEYLGRRVWVRWDARLVRICNDRLEPLAVHVRLEPGRFSTHQAHLPAAKVSAGEKGAAWLLGRIALVGSQAVSWAQAVLAQRGVEGMRVLQGLLALVRRHPSTSIDHACGLALSSGEYRLRTIRTLISKEAPVQEALPFVEEHPLIRPLADYEQLVSPSLAKEQ
jgi:transposase